MKEHFRDYNPSAHTKSIIEQADKIITGYMAKGNKITLRQLYYRFVAHQGWENKHSNYQKLSRILSDAREAGMIDWEALEDRTRDYEEQPLYDFPDKDAERVIDSELSRRAQAIKSKIEEATKNLDEAISGISSFSETPQVGDMDLYIYSTQPYCEVWVEKDAQIGIVAGICDKLRTKYPYLGIGYYSCRGYDSNTQLYRTAKRLKPVIALQRKVIIFYLGDHDPSGLDMPRNITQQLKLYTRDYDELGDLLDQSTCGFSIKPIALTKEQVRRYDLPPNLVKQDDPRSHKYITEHGKECWELDALEPEVVQETIKRAIEGAIDHEEIERREKEKDQLQGEINKRWIECGLDKLKIDVDCSDVQEALSKFSVKTREKLAELKLSLERGIPIDG